MYRVSNILRLDGETEDYEQVIENVDRDVEFRGTNLWILVFAIFIASLGLNVNSTAVVIGAMLVSPLMGPIIGLGMGMAINDLALLRKALANYSFALAAGLITSTIYFALTPLREASPEILARTSPNIYDVLIAVFGGFAGILAVSSKHKGNVIPGVAIATALMPPLCVAGYGLANWNMTYFFGAIYLFVINTVFIAWATLVTVRFLRFPLKHLPEKRDEVVAKRIVWAVVLITLLPSIYFGYDVVQQNRFRQNANKFIEAEAAFPNNYLLKRTVDGKHRSISLTYGGEYLPRSEIDALKAKLPVYGLANADLQIQQGFSYLNNEQNDDQEKQVASVLNEKEKELHELKDKLSAFQARADLQHQILGELKAQYPQVTNCLIGQPEAEGGQWTVLVSSDKPVAAADRERIEKYLSARIGAEDLAAYFEIQPAPPKPQESPAEHSQPATPAQGQ